MFSVENNLTNRLGVNIIGHLSANLGIGVFARLVAKFFVSLGYDVVGFDIDAGWERSGTQHDFPGRFVSSPDGLPHDINIFVFPPETIANIHHATNGFNADWIVNKFNAAVFFWELQIIPRDWCPALQSMDAILAPTDFIFQMLSSFCQGPVIIDAPISIALPSLVEKHRMDFELPDNAIIFVASFEPFSDPERKNIAATIAAFQQGVGHLNDVWLIIKNR